MSKLILVFGTPGAGKTTLLEGNKTVTPLTLGDELHNAYKRKFGVMERDAIRKHELMAPNEMAQIRNAILKKIIGMPGKVALNTHPSIKTGDGYLPGFSTEDLQLLKGNTKAILYIDGDTKEIIARRNRDKSRVREADSIEELNRHKEVNIAISSFLAVYLEVPIYVIKNQTGKLAESKGRVEQILADIKW